MDTPLKVPPDPPWDPLFRYNRDSTSKPDPPEPPDPPWDSTGSGKMELLIGQSSPSCGKARYQIQTQVSTSNHALYMEHTNKSPTHTTTRIKNQTENKNTDNSIAQLVPLRSLDWKRCSATKVLIKVSQVSQVSILSTRKLPDQTTRQVSQVSQVSTATPTQDKVPRPWPKSRSMKRKANHPTDTCREP